MPGDIRVGISGWRYAPWRGTFYPEGLLQADELAYASRSFRSIEINGTFYALQRPEYFAAWAAETPPGFVFSVKAPRYITHIRRLKEVASPLANFLASGLFTLGPKLGPILWQLPPDLRFDAARIEAFLALLPHDYSAAAALAARHDAKLAGRTSLPQGGGRLRHALEIRSDSFLDPDFIRLLRGYDVALVCADTVAWPRRMDLTSDFVYCRLHGSEELYTSGYDDPALNAWAVRAAAWAAGGEPADAERIVAAPTPALAAPTGTARDVFIYFDNDAKVRAPVDAQRLARRLAICHQ